MDKYIEYKKILLTHDGSKLADLALPHLISIAKAFHSEVIITQVIDSLLQVTSKIAPVPFASDGTETVEISKRITETEKQAATHNLSMLKKLLEGSGIEVVQTKIQEGIPSDEIVNLANTENCNLIIISTHGRSGLGRVLLGSVADQVTKNAPCPVLLVHSKKQ